jgi:hypothetical protein
MTNKIRDNQMKAQMLKGKKALVTEGNSGASFLSMESNYTWREGWQ